MIRRMMEEVEAKKGQKDKKDKVLLFLPFLLPPSFHH